MHWNGLVNNIMPAFEVSFLLNDKNFHDDTMMCGVINDKPGEYFRGFVCIYRLGFIRS